MEEVRDFVVFSSEEDKAEAKEIIKVLRNLKLDGDLYENMGFLDLDQMVKDTIAKFFICSKHKMSDTMKKAKEILLKKEESILCPVWLSPGKDSIEEDDERRAELYGMSTLKALIANHGGKTDIEFINSNEFKEQVSGIVKDSIDNEKKAELKRRNRQQYDIGIHTSTSDLAGRCITAEKAGGVDVLGHELFAKRIVKVMIESPTFDTPSTIGIFAPWGSGKSHFINAIKNQCKPKPDRLYVKTTQVNCCLSDQKISWCAKLLTLTIIALLITLGTVATACAFVYRDYSAHNVTSCANYNISLQNGINSNSTPSYTLSTGGSGCPNDDIKEDFLDDWTYAAIVLVILLVFVLSMSCCQRKVFHDICSTCRDCCCLTKTSGQNTGHELQNMVKNEADRKQPNGCSIHRVCCCVTKPDPTDAEIEIELLDLEQIEGVRPPLIEPIQNGDRNNATCCGFRKETGCCENCCVNSRVLCFMSMFKPAKAKEEGDISIITVDFNAWEFSGCEILWAGIVTTLGSEIENYFGKWQVRLCRLILSKSDSHHDADKPRSYAYVCCKMRHKFYIILLLSFFFLVVATTLVIIAGVKEGMDSFSESYVYWLIATSITSLTVLLAAFASVTKVVAKSTKSFVDDIRKDMIGEDFQQELGFMHKIKEEVHHLTHVIHYMSRLYGYQFRILLSIDDLDRCSPNRIMGILEAVNLLLEPENNETKSPFISILAIDPRVVLGAIERHFDPDQRKDYSQANVNGYEYLKKIIHMPFCLPSPTLKEKEECIEYLLRKADPIKPVNKTHPLLKRPSDAEPSQPKQDDYDDISVSLSDGDEALEPNKEPEVDQNQDRIYDPDSLLDYLKNQLRERQLLTFIHGNPRTLKRICNILLLALGVFRGKMVRPRALKLMLVIVMVEQWPFRTSFLLQYYLGKKQKSKESAEESTEVGDLRINKHPERDREDIRNLAEKELFHVWKDQQHKVLKIEKWKKFLSYDYDPELFYSFIATYRLRIKHLEEYIIFAVNHDTNIESIVEQGLAELDLADERDN